MELGLAGKTVIVTAGRVRLLGKTSTNIDFSLNYILIRTGPFGMGDPI